MRKLILLFMAIIILLISGCTKKGKKEETIWKVLEYKPITSEEYFSTEHIFTEKSENIPVLLADNTKMVSAQGKTDGIEISGFVDSENIASQYMLKGDYSNYEGINGGDGYWFYFVKNNSQLVRVNVNGEEQVILDVKIENIIDMRIYDQDLMYLLYWKDNKAVINQIYMSDIMLKEIEIYDKNKMIGDYDVPKLLVQESSNYISYAVLNEQFREKYEQLMNELDTLYELLIKHGYTGTKEATIDNYSLSRIVNAIYDEYGISYLQKVGYNIKTGYSEVSDMMINFDMDFR